MNNNVLQFLEKILGKGKVFSNSEVYFSCPICHHHKKKLAINIDTYEWQCWVCSNKNGMRGKSLFSLLKKINASDKIKELNSILGSKHYADTDINTVFKVETNNKKIVKLPSEFKSFTKKSNMPDYKNALLYLTKRNISFDDIIKYNIGYCDKGIYSGYIVFPSYDENANLNYFVTRSFYNHPMKYKNPDVSKDIIFNELHIDWTQDIVICEGVFDALAIKRNAIPLLGKSIRPKLKEKLLTNCIKRIRLCLDNDALLDSIKIIEDLMRNGMEMYLVELPYNEDPSSLGFYKTNELIMNSKLLNFFDLIQLKLNNKKKDKHDFSINI